MSQLMKDGFYGLEYILSLFGRLANLVMAKNGPEKKFEVQYPKDYSSYNYKRVGQHMIRDSLLGSSKIEFAQSFYPPSENKTFNVFYLGDSLSGHPGIVHGGFISALFDECFGELLYVKVAKGSFTAYLKTEFKKKTNSNSLVRIATWVERIEGRKVFVKGEMREFENGTSILDQAGDLLASGEALFVTPRMEHA